MLNADEALRIILESAPRLGTEMVRLQDAVGRTTAGAIVSREDLPGFDNSSMDGFAVRSRDLADASGDQPVRLAIAGESSAGNVYRGKLRQGQAVKIMTGGKIPDGLDAVVPLERVRVSARVGAEFVAGAPPGAYIRRIGEDVRRGEQVIRSGERMGAAHMAVCAALGRTRVKVAVKPLVAILATGSELVAIEKKPRDGQIRNSTSFGLAAQVIECGGIPRLLGIAGDHTDVIARSVKKGLRSNALVITGGVSVGKYDLVKEVLESLGVRSKFWRVNIKPGKPLLFGVYRKTLVFGLPGNPVSTAVTFREFVLPALRKMMGREQVLPMRIPAVIDQEFKKTDGKRHFVRAIARPWGSHLHVHLTGTQSSGAMSSLLKANCLMIVPEETMTLNPGDPVEVELV